MTILSSIIGVVILILQVSKSFSLTLGVVGGLLIFAIVIGIFHQWGIVDKYADLVHYAGAINEIKTNIVKYLPATASTIYEIPGMTSSPADNANKSPIDRWEARMWWLFPINVHQLFIAFMNSICLATLIWIPILYTRTVISNVGKGATASFIVFWLSIIANDTYAKIKLRRELSRNNRKIGGG
jgi:hypothetical protein